MQDRQILIWAKLTKMQPNCF